jgi:rhodanese-related sulfurtransferase
LFKKLKICCVIASLVLTSCNYLFPDLTSEKIDVKEAYSFLKKHKGDVDVVLLDLRTKEEFDKLHVEGAVNMDFAQTTFPGEVEKLDKEKRYLLIDLTQRKSLNTLQLMMELRFDKVHVVMGGMEEWTKQGLPVTF